MVFPPMSLVTTWAEELPAVGGSLLSAPGGGVLAVSAAALFVRLADAPALSTAAYRLLFASVPTLALLPLRGRRELPALRRGDWGWLETGAGCGASACVTRTPEGSFTLAAGAGA